MLGLPPYPQGVSPPLLTRKRNRYRLRSGPMPEHNPASPSSRMKKGPLLHFFAYDVKFDGGVRVDMADLNGDGVPELIVAPGPSKNFGEAAGSRLPTAATSVWRLNSCRSRGGRADSTPPGPI